MAFKATETADCMMIAKRFERGAIYSTNEESVFAMMGPVLDGMRVQSQSYIDQSEATESISAEQGAEETLSSPQNPNSVSPVTSNILGAETTSNVARNMDKSDENDSSFVEKLQGNFGLADESGNFSINGIFDSKCIPCGFRLDELDSFFTAVGTGFLGGLSEYLQFWENLLKKQWQQLQDMLSLFTNTDPFIDLCAFIKFFTDFMCVPDIARILSALMALMNRMSFQFSGVFDLILQFVGPLLSPFLSNLIGTLQQYIFMIIKPIECIIDSVQALIAKLDYNVLFQNIDSLDKHIDMGGPRRGANLPGNEANEQKLRREDPRGDYIFRLNKPRTSSSEPKTPWIDAHIPRRDIAEGDRFTETGFNMAGPLGTVIKSENAKNQKAVDEAGDELAATRKAGRNVDGSDPEAVKKQREKERAAETKYRQAVEKRDLSYLGRANQSIERGVAGLKSSLIMIIGYLREAASTVQGFFDFIFDEFKKLMGEYVGGSGGFIGELIRKLALSQLIGIITQIYKALQRGAVCPEDANDIKVENWIPQQQGFKIWTDEEGGIHIEGDEQEIEDAINETVRAVGTEPKSGAGGAQSSSEKDKGTQPSTPGQKLKSLIEFTGDPVLDSDIARMTEQLVTPVNVVFKCPLQTSVAQTEQINQWIKEVNS